ncbi:extracellular ligand-binding receptor [Candidatus Thiomargarita nelsonii]|uniref:Extracellular ligand-binding receptor n=1 Tax=Candidatus Thiomargarita nelsonii TaxID=1003181 RepID=A0A176RV78_9GAMM|nr:extracellular ligand-binding receptor [Candidatus Thiomargarita nelsonii]
MIDKKEAAALDVSLTDDKSQQLALEIADSLATNPTINAIIGHRFSQFAIQAASVYQSQGIVFIAPTLTNLNLSRFDLNYTFRMRPNNEEMGRQLAVYCHKTGYKKIVVLQSQDNDGNELADSFIYHTVEKYHHEIVAHHSFSRDTIDFTALMTDLKTLPAFDAILLATDVDMATRIYQATRELNITVPFIGGEKLDSERFWKPVKKWENSETTPKSTLLTVFNPSSHIAQAFVKHFKQEYGQQLMPDRLAALGYDSIKLLAHGMEKAKSTDSTQLAQTLQNMLPCQGVTAQYSFRMNGDIMAPKLLLKRISQDQFEYEPTENKNIIESRPLILGLETCGNLDQDKDGIPNDTDVCPDNSLEEISKGVYQQGSFKGCSVDSDKDGYQDYRDTCPNTLSHELEKGIDSNGCPMDTDKDGVLDYKDLCATNLLASTLVDAQGCAPDADQDNVPDDKDMCPDNSSQEISKGIFLQGAEMGCPIDSDNDKVPDYRDDCPKNSHLELIKGINSRGCSTDRDKDGIPNYEDVCFDNNPKELSKGVYQQGEQAGCPIDSDNDHVSDYRDDCPKNQAEEIKTGVDPLGCPLDTDQDGVYNYQDNCPNNSHLELKNGVDSRGCPLY